jgi:hypothetical protein
MINSSENFFTTMDINVLQNTNFNCIYYVNMCCPGNKVHYRIVSNNTMITQSTIRTRHRNKGFIPPYGITNSTKTGSSSRRLCSPAARPLSSIGPDDGEG